MMKTYFRSLHLRTKTLMKPAKEKFIMRRSIIVIAACFCTGIFIICGHGYTKKTPTKKPVNIGSRLEIFVDSSLIENLFGVELRLQSPIKQPLPHSPLQGASMAVITEAFIRPGLDPDSWENQSNYVVLNVVPTGPSQL